MTFVRKFVYQYLCPWLWWIIFVTFTVFMFWNTVLQIETYIVFVSEKTVQAQTSRVRFTRVCSKPGDVYDMKFEKDCSEWERQQHQNVYWEAFVEVARTWQLCHPTRGCTSSVYIVVGMIIGVCFALWGLNKIPTSYMNYIDRMNHEEDLNFLLNPSDKGLFNFDLGWTGFGSKGNSCAHVPEVKKKKF